MPELFIYLIKGNVVLVLFYLVYRFLLRALTFYTLNRIFLFLGISFSVCYPFIDLSTFFAGHEALGSKLVLIREWPIAADGTSVVAAAETTNYWAIAETIFWCGVVLMAVRLLIQLISLYRLHRLSEPGSWNGYHYRDVAARINPFSFWNTIYLNSSQLKENELGSVLRHEEIHVKEWHTTDVLVSELSTIFYWFNPGAWLMKSAVKENLEFITDERILQKGMDSRTYQYDLLHISSLQQTSPIVNHFSLLTLKNRIIMMNKERSSKRQLSRYLLLTPAVIVLALIFTASRAEEGSPKSNGQRMVDAISEQLSIVSEAVLPKTKIRVGKEEKARVPEVLPALESESVTLPEPAAPSMAAFPISDAGTDTARYILDGKPVENLHSINPNEISSVHVVKGASAEQLFGKGYEKGAVVIFSMTNNNSEASAELRKKMGLQNFAFSISELGFPGNGAATLSGRVAGRDLNAVTVQGRKLEPSKAGSDEVVVIGRPSRIVTRAGTIGRSGKVTETQTRVNGELVRTIVEQEFNSASSQEPTRVIGYATKSGLSTSGLLNDTKGMLVLVDGKESAEAEYKALPAEKIKSISISESSKKYGEKGKNGVITITTKK